MPITLQKSGDSHQIDLSKSGSGQSLTIHVNLNWTQPKSGGLFSKLVGNQTSAPDLDLGCMFEMMSGEKGVIQPIGGAFGSKHQPPYIFLDKDDRSGSAADGENLFIYRPEMIRRIMFFAMIYQGASDFKSVGGRMSFQVSNGEEIYLELNNPDANQTFCAAAMVNNLGSRIAVLKEERYFRGHPEADSYYGFGFRWVAGSK